MLSRFYFCILFSQIILLDLYAQPMQYRSIGPSRGGRVTAVSGVDSQPHVSYMGATGGGLWKSEDYGIHWRNISDGYFKTPAIGAIAVYQKNPEIIYVGTGSDGIRSNVIVGKGIYKSLDAGKTWTFTGLEKAGQIGALEIHPDNPDIAYAAVVGQPFRKSQERGVYKTTDGGASWQQILYHSDSVGAVDLELSPDNPDLLYATMWRAERKPWTIISGGATDGIFKSSDGGKTWTRKTQGLPSSLFGKSDLAVSAAQPARVWAQIQAAEGQEGIYKSEDYGETWAKVKMPDNVHKSVMYRPFYFTNIDVNPKNADNIWAGTKQLWTSYDAGVHWQKVMTPHADHHDLWINPSDTTLMICGNDGGAGVSRDGGKNWSHPFNQPTAELYSCDVDDQYPYYLYSGQQDNSTIRVPHSPPFLDVMSTNDNHGMTEMMYWERVGGCETGPVVPKPGSPHMVYANCKGQFSVYNKKTGREKRYYVGAESLYGNHPDDITYRFQRVSPIEVSPHDPEVVYYGSQYIHKTKNAGLNWQIISPDLTANDPRHRMRSGGPIDEDISGEEYYATLYAIQESPVKQGVIWSGSNDGLIQVTIDDGQTWKNVTPDMPAGGRVSNIEASPHDAAKAYFAVYRDYLGDDGTYIYKTTDYGQSWTKITQGIPENQPARVLREDPKKEGVLLAGTEFGIYVSFDDGLSWRPFQRNLPIVPITDMQFVRGDLALSTLGRSFWIMDDISPLRQYELISSKKLTLFKPRDIVEGHQYIHFILPKNSSDTIVHFEFSRHGQMIHSKKEPISKLPMDEFGIRKTTWDMKYYFPNGEKDFGGPKVAPGTYDVKIKYAGKTQKESFQLLYHPEYAEDDISQSELEQQETLAVKIAQILLEVKAEIRKLEKQIKNTEDVSLRKLLKEKRDELKKGPRRYDQPKLHEHIEYLYKMVSKVPQNLGRDATERYLQLKEVWEKY